MRYKLNRLFKKTASDLFYFAGRLKKPFPKEENSFRILLYHSIGEKDRCDTIGIRLTKQEFFQQMEFLFENKYNVVRLRDLIKLLENKERIPEKSVAITFDDGYRDNITEAVPILKEFNFPAIIFVCADYIGLSIRESGYCAIQGGFLNQNDLRQLLKFNIDIGLHSSSHRPLTKLSIDEVEREVIASKIKLEAILNRDVQMFSYPHGVFNRIVVDVLCKNKFIAACCSITGKNDYATEIYQLKRTEILRGDSLFEFKKKISGYYDWINNLIIKKQYSQK